MSEQERGRTDRGQVDPFILDIALYVVGVVLLVWSVVHSQYDLAIAGVVAIVLGLVVRIAFGRIPSWEDQHAE